MRKNSNYSVFAAVMFAAGSLLAMPACADKPPWAGGGKPEGEQGGKGQGRDKQQGGGKQQSSGKQSGQPQRSSYFDSQQHTVVRDYYTQEFKGGKCPPGLSKKNNGCMPPGQAKKWNKGYPLPRDLVYYDLPSQLVVRLGPPPSGHKYVRVASDILLIAIGTSMVVDAISDLGRM
jgi:Ni/Co efflux regulator RcnB